jgi:hypothetical protein
VRGGQLTLGAVRWIRGQRRGALEESGCGCQAASSSGSVGRALELRSYSFVWRQRRLGTMPRPAIGIEPVVGGCRQSFVRAPSLIGRRRAVNRGAQERVAKGHSGAEREQARGFRRPQRLRPQIETFGRTPQERRIADRLCRSDEQQALTVDG